MKVKLRLQIRFNDSVIGPGKIALLESVAQHGSISGAGKACGMTFRRAWQLIETVQEALGQPLVETTVGGKGGGGAELTPFAKSLIEHYRKLEKQANGSAGPLFELLNQTDPGLS
ncbi:winged helix-turn-helix domain-containing protein [Sedimenticola hydrogenitrophicus]|uniref:winged helix-turn-helix domain-containing protein n=1 Tax=Sedimenticola hydrogenitrophicus TaxID=2967975 RepID=UPI0023AFC857|nr:LysR family transcriptional regulator [Sedimenticola hydrogenitrophicus]